MLGLYSLSISFRVPSCKLRSLMTACKEINCVMFHRIMAELSQCHVTVILAIFLDMLVKIASTASLPPLTCMLNCCSRHSVH
jgi:hypothetical protein